MIKYGRRSKINDLLNEICEKSSAPIACMLNITRRCNLKCIHCYQTNRANRELTTAQWKEVIGGLARAGVLMLVFSGGEPFVRKDFMELVRYARKKRFSITIKTNAVLINEKSARALSRIAISEMQISLYSLKPEVHDRITQVKGSFRKLMDALHLLKKNEINISLSIPAMNINIDEIPEMVKFAKEEGFQFSIDPSLTICEDGTGVPANLRPSQKQLTRLLLNSDLVDMDAVGKSAVTRCLSSRVCNAGRASLTIDSDGDVYPCALLPIKLGNIKENKILQIWQNPVRKFINSIRWLHLYDCQHCTLWRWCTRCHGIALIEDGDMLGCSSLAKYVTEAKLKAIRKWQRKKASPT